MIPKYLRALLEAKPQELLIIYGLLPSLITEVMLTNFKVEDSENTDVIFPSPSP